MTGNSGQQTAERNGREDLTRLVRKLLGSDAEFARIHQISDLRLANEQRERMSDAIVAHLVSGSTDGGDVSAAQLERLYRKAKRVDRKVAIRIGALNSAVAFGPFGAAGSAGAMIGGAVGTLVGGPIGAVLGGIIGGTIGCLVVGGYGAVMATALGKVMVSFRKARPEFTQRTPLTVSKSVTAYYAGFIPSSTWLPASQIITNAVVPAASLISGVAFGGAGIALAPICSGVGGGLTAFWAEKMSTRSGSAFFGVSRDKSGKLTFNASTLDETLGRLKKTRTSQLVREFWQTFRSILRREIRAEVRNVLANAGTKHQAKRSYRALAIGAFGGVIEACLVGLWGAPGMFLGSVRSIGNLATLLGPWGKTRLPKASAMAPAPVAPQQDKSNDLVGVAKPHASRLAARVPRKDNDGPLRG